MLTISQAQRDLYQSEGYLILPAVISSTFSRASSAQPNKGEEDRITIRSWAFEAAAWQAWSIWAGRVPSSRARLPKGEL